MRATSVDLNERAEVMRGWVERGYTVREAGREMGLTRHQSEHLAKVRGIRCLQGALSEAKSEAAIKGNRVRWGV
jgi:hypothetical protein